jgi:glycosyltransferase involved in cell wall biosynthesis
MSKPLVSIILPTHNGSRFIKKSIESCLSQSYKNLELIVVDDCSTDDTDVIVEEYIKADNRVKLIRNQKNLKLPLSLNKGFDAASGEFLTWTSDDNYYSDHAIETMVDFLIHNQDHVLVYSNYTIIDENDQIVGEKKFHDVNLSMVKWLGCGACFLYQKSLHDQLKGYDPSAFLIEDYDFFLRGLLVGKYKYMERTDLYHYRVHSGSLTSLYGHYNIDLMKIVVERRLSQLISICSHTDKILWYRKFAVYYGVRKNNANRMNIYIGKLFKVSAANALVTVVYIVFMKITTGLHISIQALATLAFSAFRIKKIS